MESSWRVTFEPNGPEGTKIPLEKNFLWGAYGVYIPAVYLFEEGLVLDLCLEVNREKAAAFLEKWKDALSGKPNNHIFRKMRAENPLMHRFSRKLWVNGVELKRSSGWGDSHIPWEMLPEEYRRQPGKPFVEGQGLDKNKVWTYFQMKYFWEGSRPEKIRTIDIHLSQDPYECFAEVVPTPEIGEGVRLTHPKTGDVYTLTVKDIRQETVNLPPQPGVVFPDNVLVMSYEMEPDLPRQKFYLTNLAEGDQPRKGNGESTGQSSAWGLLLRNPDHYTVSSAHFEPVKTVTWQAVFLEKDMEDLRVKLL